MSPVIEAEPLHEVLNNRATPQFQAWPKISRLSRDVVVTEKIDGSCALIHITEEGDFHVGSRNRWLSSTEDNFGFYKWAKQHEAELSHLGKGYHYGEWWGSGIQRGYGLKNGVRVFSLFNTGRWRELGDGQGEVLEGQAQCPQCCSVVPVLYRGPFDTSAVDSVLEQLKVFGSVAEPGFSKPEGIVVYHTAANMSFKKTIVGDEKRKSET